MSLFIVVVVRVMIDIHQVRFVSFRRELTSNNLMHSEQFVALCQGNTNRLGSNKVS